MRILHVIHDHPHHPTIGGGGAVRVHEISRRLAARGHEIHIVSGRFEGCEAYASAAENPRVTFLGTARKPASRAVEFALATWRALPKMAAGFDVVIEDFSPYAPVGSWRLRRKGLPVVLQIQNYAGREFVSRHGIAGLSLAAVESWYPRLFRHHILVGDFLRTRFPGTCTEVIPQGFTPDLRVSSGDPARNHVAVLGRIDFHQKGLDRLLPAVAINGLPVWFAGAGPDQPRLEKALENLAGSRFLGKIHGDQKWDFLRGARFLVMPSRFEGQPVVAIEAAASGTPILASTIPELNFVTEEGIGRQADPDDPREFSAAMRNMWETAAANAEYAEKAKRFSRKHTWDQITIRFESALQKIVGK